MDRKAGAKACVEYAMRRTVLQYPERDLGLDMLRGTLLGETARNERGGLGICAEGKLRPTGWNASADVASGGGGEEAHVTEVTRWQREC